MGSELVLGELQSTALFTLIHCRGGDKMSMRFTASSKCKMALVKSLHLFNTNTSRFNILSLIGHGGAHKARYLVLT